MERKALGELIKWKNKQSRKPLLVTGVRQCGKTYLLKDFGKREFEDTAYFSFDRDTSLKSVFDYDLNPARIIDELESTVLGRKVIPGKTLVIFDEIQECPRAITALKYFCEDLPQLHVVAAGSLLGVALRHQGISFPVGKIDRLEMYPMSFEEFANADGEGKFIDLVNGFAPEREIPDIASIPMEKTLKNYLIVGGMPEAVQTWINTHDYREVDQIQGRILKDYADDFGKYSTPDTANKIKLIWDAIPAQIARENNKFIFSHISSGARAKDLEDALEWLVSAGIAYKLSMVPTPELPLSGMADSTYFKVYMSDVGLLRNKAGISFRTIFEDDQAYIRFKGAMAENYVMTQLKSMGIESYFWRSKADAEIDFITDYDGRLLPIEVKAATNTKAKSLHLFCNRYTPQMAVKTSLKNVGDNMDGSTHVWSIPLYTLFRLRDYIEYEISHK